MRSKYFRKVAYPTSDSETFGSEILQYHTSLENRQTVTSERKRVYLIIPLGELQSADNIRYVRHTNLRVKGACLRAIAASFLILRSSTHGRDVLGSMSRHLQLLPST